MDLSGGIAKNKLGLVRADVKGSSSLLHVREGLEHLAGLRVKTLRWAIRVLGTSK